MKENKNNVDDIDVDPMEEVEANGTLPYAKFFAITSLIFFLCVLLLILVLGQVKPDPSLWDLLDSYPSLFVSNLKRHITAFIAFRDFGAAAIVLVPFTKAAPQKL